ncbi:hypothetical protein SPRG_20326 [Saprolegnia parasitica CBS 223.65]|uniref:Uncharacterized protein n=1 Tax=Saprolegnia parasitica (strain CBS 223.65) TaxID=695850 RepID=A0A067CLE0_SAPPC|nr:hypothetical protein SPRG_20326 [Saprolegnia parasitica CBS 223.65]KDO27361.1 hypothetical protein SPRG_20326 [Saprolegnia parasitica CBS 223.65]|eukprot:XP_012201940.1 hypothetical protein SPRG_20326 [Saprolegnia parasitica CBS 223.65]
MVIDDWELLPEWEFAREHIESLGLGLIMVMFHQLWTLRNRVKYEDGRPPRATYVFGVTVVRWLSHVRHWLRPGNTSDDKIDALRQVIDHLLAQPAYANLRDSFRYAFPA